MAVFPVRWRWCALALVFGAVSLPATRAAVPDQPAPQPQPPRPGAPPVPAVPAVSPASIWQASLGKLVGTYRFAQVASPGGLWDSFQPSGGGPVVHRQVAMDDLPAPLRTKLLHAEITISDLGPTEVEASERTSPSGRGKLRFYSETGVGHLTLKNLPGIGGMDGDGDYNGAATFHVEHTRHSNPSVSGVLILRRREEATWGAAILDYADLSAEAVVRRQPLKPGEPSPNGASKLPKPGGPSDEGGAAGGAPARQADPRERGEGNGVMVNARVLRSHEEIFSVVDWTGKDASGIHRIYGCVRLLLQIGAPPIVSPPAPPQKVAPVAAGM